uniref:Cytochrome c biogenesis protein CcsA n=1 Tax=Selaginella lepidophylla TaxID=59777 RepID=A0A3T0IB28_SELLP|nr:cytochrome c heme attachment protein [Selaginella lepidophylla]AZU95899.1 cytochrome c heme attachment protein [Selaginella lepidophylla]
MLAYIPLSLPLSVTIPYRGRSVCGGRSEELNELGQRGMVIAFVCITGSLLNRWVYTGHLPLSDLYESSTFLSWSLCLTHMAIIRGRNDWLGTITAPGAMLTHGFAAIGASGDMPRSTVSVPALQSHWLMMHVSMMMLSYATLLCGSSLAMASPVVASGERPDFIGDLSIPARFSVIGDFARGYGERPLSIPISLYTGHRESKLSQLLDRRSYRTISLGFLFLTLGTLSGAVWANEAWGYYWDRDPKETWALITWLTFAIYLHTRIIRGWQGAKPAIVASLGFFIIWICHSGVNPSGRGSHSHGWLI